MKNFLFVRLVILAGLLSTGLWQAGAASVSLKAIDALGTHSWAGSTNWDNGAVPSAGNDYFTKNFQIRTPNPATNGAAGTNPIAFAGSSLSIDPGGSMNTKHFGNFTNASLLFNGGLINLGDVFNITNYGTITLNATTNSTLTTDTQARQIDVRSTIIGTGSSRFVITNIWGGVVLSGPNQYTNIVAITNAYVKLNNIWALGGTNGGTTIGTLGVLDLNGINLTNENLTVIGGGTNGSIGAIINSGAALVNNGIRANVTMTGATTIGGANRFDFMGPLTFTGAGFKLTKQGAAEIGMNAIGNIGVGDIDVAAGQLTLLGNTTLGNAGNTLNVLGGATLALFAHSSTVASPLSKVWVMQNNANFNQNSGTAVATGPMTLQGVANFGGGGTYLTNLGPVSGVGGVVKSGAHTLALVGTNSFTGNLTVNAGRLVLGPPATIYSAPVITVASGATLDVMPIPGGLALANGSVLQGSGVVTGALVVSPSAAILPGGDGVAGTLLVTNGDVSFNHQSILRVDLSSASTTIDGGTNDLLVVNGNLNLSGSNIVLFSFLNGLAPAPGQYTIIRYSGALTGSAANFISANYGATFDTTTPGEVRVTFTGSPSGTNLVWKGDGAGNLWNPALTPNWLNGGLPAVFFPGDFATFDDTGSNNVPVNLSGTLLPAGVLVNAAKDYIFAGSGSLNVGSLTKQGGGTLAISNANSYGGGTYVRGGTVRIGNVNALGANTSLVVATNGGAIDLNGVDQSAKNFNYLASGTGPDGLGALRNSANVGLDAAKSGIRNLTLAGDTTVNALANRFDIGAGGGVDGRGFKFTKTGPFILPFRGAVSNVSEFNVNAGRLYGEQFSLQLTSVVNVAAGAALGAYSYDGTGGNTNSAIINLNGGSLGAEGSQSVNSGPVVWTGLINVNADSILNPSQGNGNTDVRLENTLNGTRHLVAVPGAGARATILAANSDATYSGNWTINPSATLRLGGTAGSTGSGTVTNNGTVQFQRTAPSSFGGTIRGGGILEHMAGSEQLTLTGTSFANQLKVQSTNAARPLVLGAGSTTWVTNSLNVPNDNFYGRMQINPGATLNVLNGFFLGGEAASRTGEVAQVGGDVTVSGQFRLAHWPTEISTYAMQGGTFTIPTLPVGSVNGSEINGGFYIGVDGVGLFTQSGGTINVPALVMDSRGSSVLGTATNTYSLEGGRLNLGVGGIKSGTTDATTTYQINLGGGTVGASADWTSSRVLNFGGTNGNVTFDTGPNTITLSSYIYGAGGLNKQGPGALVLSGVNTFSNASTLNAGTLLANGLLGTNQGSLTVNGGVLAGSGQVLVPVTVNGGTLTAGTNGVAGTLVVSNNTTLNAGARLLFDLASATAVGGGVNDLLMVRSNLTLNASTPVVFNFLNGAPNTAAPYTLAHVAGTMTGVPANLTAPSHYSAVFSVANGTNLQVQFGGAASNLTWIGDGLANLWDAGGALNWTNGVAMDFFGAGDIVNFNDDGSNNVPVTLVGNLAPSNIVVSANNSYNFAGSGRIVGASGLSKSGNGALILTNAHDFTGNTLINGGSVVIGGDSSLGTAPAAYTPGKLVLNGGAVQAAGCFAINPNRGIAVGPSAGTIGVNGGNILISGAIITNNGAVNGALVKRGTGVLRLTGGNAFTGDATLSQGAVVIYNNNSLGSNNTVRLGDANTGSSDVELLLEGQTTGFGFPRPIVVSAAAGGVVKIGSTFGAGANPQFNNTLTLNRDVTLVGTNTDRTTFAGQITGTGNINIVGPNRVVFTAANTNNFVGNINIASGALQIGVASAVLNTIPDTSSVNVGDAAWFNISVNAESIDALTGVGWVQGFSPATAPATLTVGASGGGGNFGGILTNGNSTLALIKAGAGTQTLSGRNTYTGNTVINGGVLALAATGSISNSAQISVNSNAVFNVTASGGFTLGDGKSIVGNNGFVVGNFTAQSNSTVSPNGFSAAGTLTFANNLVLDRGAFLNWNLTNAFTIGAGMNDLVNVNGDLVLNGTNAINIFPLAGNLALGTYRLINYSGALVGSASNLRAFSGVATTRYTLTIDASTPGQINLVVGSPLAGNLAWRGNVNANWNINTDANWLNGLAADRFFNGDSVLFDETALQYSVGVPVTVVPGPVTVNGPYNYAFSGLGKINGSAGITKNGAGILTLGNTNDFTGSITVNGGILRAGVSNAFGFSSGITIANGAQVDINGLAARAINYTMAGFGPDGRGALISGAGGPHGANICPVASVTLTGNAGVWSASGTVWDFFGGVFDAQGYSLTKLGPGRFDIFNTRTTNLSELIVREGIVYSEGNFGGVTLNDNFGTNATVYAGAVLAQFGNVFANTRITLNGGMLASSGNTLNSVLWNGPINLASNSTVGYFNIFNSGGTYFSNHINIAGPISGPGSLTMVGTATNILYLAGTNTYTGNTVVQAGRVTLLPTGSLSNSAVISIAAGASLDVQAVAGGFSLAPTQTLAGSGFVLGAVSDNTGAAIQPGGLATFGTLTISNNVTLNGGGTLLFDLNSAATTEGAGVNDLLSVSNLAVNAATTIRLNPLGGAFIASGTYTLVNYSGTLTGQGNLSVVTDMTGATATLDFSTAGKIRVNVVNGSSAPLVWLGDLDFGNPTGNWLNDALVLNWYDGSGQTFFTAGSTVTFNDDFNNSPTVNLIGSLAPGAIVVSSFDNQFSFIGSGSLGGGGLAKAGQSTMTLANSGVNNWSGPTDIRAGTLRVGNGGTIGALPGTIITNNANLIFNRADTITVANTLVGTGATIQQGPGNLLLSGNSSASYIGGLYVYGGTLTPSSPLAVGATNVGSAAITVATGGTLDLNGQTFGSKPVVISGTGVGGLGAVVNSGAAQLNALQFLSLSGDATIGGLNRWDVRGPVTAVNLAGSTLTKTGLNNVYFVQPVIGDGNIVLNQGVLGFEVGTTATNSPGSNGIIIANSGTLGFGNFGLRLNVSRPIIMNGGIFQGESGSTDADVDSPITLNTNTLFDIIVPTRLTNVISGPGRLTKANSSALVLAGENTYSGGTVVSAGILQIGTNGTGSIVGDIANNATVDFANTNPVVYGGAIIGLAGTINQSRGPVRLTKNISAVNVNVQGGFSNALTIASGTSNFISGTLSVGQGLATVGAAGSLIIEPGSVINSANYMMGQQAGVTGQVMQIGGDITVSAQFRLGHWPTEVSTYVMGGGSLTMMTLPASNPAGTSAAEQSGGFYIGIDGVGLFTQTGGVVTTHGLVMDNRGSSVFPGIVNTYALEGGTLVLGTHGIQSGGASAANQNTAFNVYLGGGTIGSISNWTSPLAMTLTGTNGDVVFNPGSFTNTLNGILSGNGGLIKNGAGTLVLGGNNTYFGQTRVNFGTLLYHGTLSASSGTLTVASGATLGGNGTISAPIVMDPGAIIAPGASIGTLTIGSALALPSSTIMEISKLNGGLSNDILRTTGTLTYGGALTVVVLANAPAFAPGDTFRLFDAPAYAGSFASMNLPALTPGLVWNTTRLAIDGTIRVAFFDITPPIIICPANLTVACSADVPPANFAGGTATDNIDAVPVVAHVGDVSTGVNPRIIVRTYRASDSLGNTNDCAQTITVQDSIAPTITCPADITVTADTNTCTAVVALGSPTASDNCTFTVTSNAPAVFPVGTTLVIWTATDAAGNTTTCTQRVKVLDSTLAITAQPQDTTNTLGTTATFTVTAAGCPTLTYQWFFLGTNLLANATNTTLALTNIQLSQAGGYSAVVANGGASVTSAVAVLTVNQPPIAGANGGVAQQGRTATLFITKFLSNDSDPDGDPISVTAVSATSTNGGSVVLSGGEVLYTPLPGFVGNDLFTYTLSDGRGGTATGNVEMYVINGNVPGVNKISMSLLPNGHVLIRFGGVPGRTYQVQRSLTLMSWSTLATLTAPAHGIIEFEDANPPMGGAFYRIALP